MQRNHAFNDLLIEINKAGKEKNTKLLSQLAAKGINQPWDYLDIAYKKNTSLIIDYVMKTIRPYLNDETTVLEFMALIPIGQWPHYIKNIRIPLSFNFDKVIDSMLKRNDLTLNESISLHSYVITDLFYFNFSRNLFPNDIIFLICTYLAQDFNLKIHDEIRFNVDKTVVADSLSYSILTPLKNYSVFKLKNQCLNAKNSSELESIKTDVKKLT